MQVYQLVDKNIVKKLNTQDVHEYNYRIELPDAASIYRFREIIAKKCEKLELKQKRSKKLARYWSPTVIGGIYFGMRAYVAHLEHWSVVTDGERSLSDAYTTRLLENFGVRPSLIKEVASLATDNDYADIGPTGRYDVRLSHVNILTLHTYVGGTSLSELARGDKSENSPVLSAGHISGHAHPFFVLTDEERAIPCTIDPSTRSFSDREPKLYKVKLGRDSATLFETHHKELHAFVDHAREKKTRVIVGGSLSNGTLVADLFAIDDTAYLYLMK